MDAGRAVSERGLVAEAVRHLTADALGGLPFEALAPTKALLKRFFSPQPWGPAEDAALADAVGPGEGWWRHQLDEDLVLEFGWIDGRFRVEVAMRAGPPPLPGDESRAATFSGSGSGPVTPEATPNPRTVMFRTGPIHEGESRPFTSGEPSDDARVSHLFRCFPDVTDVLVASDFVAVSLRRPDRWEALLGPVLHEVTQSFAGDQGPGGAQSAGEAQAGGGQVTTQRRHEGRLERAWRELGSLRPDGDPDFERVRAAAGDEDAARRQVAASLLRDAAPARARPEWQRLVHDPSRPVRRAAVDAMVDVGREELRPLLEDALDDDDAWVRWKALRGLSELGAGPSHGLIERVADDPDFRVRLEARAALDG